MTDPGKIGVLICDDHELVRSGLRALLDPVADCEVVGEAADAEEAISEVRRLHPDVVVMDVRMPGRSGIEACRDIRSEFPNTRVLMLTSFSDDEALFTSIMAGASGYVLKQVRGSDLVDAIQKVAAGQSLLDPAITTQVLARLRGEAPLKVEGPEELTTQERRVLELVAEGLTNRQIGEKLFLAEKTVKNYVSNVLSKLGLERRTQAAIYVERQRRQGGS